MTSPESPLIFALISPTRLEGREETARLDEQLESALDAGATHLLVDLRAHRRVCTAPLNALLRARGRLLGRGGRVALVAGPSLRRFCRCTGLDRRFELTETRSEAVEALGLAPAPGRDGPEAEERQAA